MGISVQCATASWGNICSVRNGMNVVKLYFPGRVTTNVEPKKVVEVPKMGRVEPKPVFMALPNYAHSEKVECDKKMVRLNELEALMEEGDSPSVDLAVEILDVTMSDAEMELRHNDYPAYALAAIKNSEKRLREEALMLHPDSCRPYARTDALFATCLAYAPPGPRNRVYSLG